MRKFSESEIEFIKKMKENGYSINQIASHFNLSDQSIYYYLRDQ